MKKIISLAYYLPQFHEIPENNSWWGKGFTEWTNLREAKQYFTWQAIRRPIPPFNEYNLLNPAVLEWQASVALDHGITGFLMWDYWFGQGKQLLEKPAKLILKHNLNFPYCFSWANHSWQNKSSRILLQEQQYLGEEDYAAYFYSRLSHFRQDNYIKIDGKPVFGVFFPQDIPDLQCFVNVFRRLAEKEGFPGVYLIAENSTEDSFPLFDRCLNSGAGFKRRMFASPLQFIKEQLVRRCNFTFSNPMVFDYRKTILAHSKRVLSKVEIPVLFSGWDTTPRHKDRGTIFKGFTLDVFRENAFNVVEQLRRQGAERPIVILKSWNEWAEGNVLEPDSVFAYDLLKAHKEIISVGLNESI